MCLNGWGGTLHEALLPYLEATAPDILCLQEVVHSPATEQNWLTYRDGAHVLPQRAHFFGEVAKALPDHIAIFCPAALGVLWDGDQPVPSHWGLATFVHRSLPIIGQAQGFVHKGYAPDGYGDHPHARSAHGVRVYDHKHQRAICVTHMHGLRDPAGKMDTPERTAQVLRLLALSDQISQPGDVAVICGDFNVEPGSDTLKILSGAGFQDLVTGGNFTGTRTALYEKPGRFADYMLINRADAVQGFDVIRDPVVSDHCPLVLKLQAQRLTSAAAKGYTCPMGFATAP